MDHKHNKRLSVATAGLLTGIMETVSAERDEQNQYIARRKADAILLAREFLHSLRREWVMIVEKTPDRRSVRIYGRAKRSVSRAIAELTKRPEWWGDEQQLKRVVFVGGKSIEQWELDLPILAEYEPAPIPVPSTEVRVPPPCPVCNAKDTGIRDELRRDLAGDMHGELGAALVRASGKIDAIKVIRTGYGYSLAQCKALVECPTCNLRGLAQSALESVLVAD